MVVSDHYPEYLFFVLPAAVTMLSIGCVAHCTLRYFIRQGYKLNRGKSWHS